MTSSASFRFRRGIEADFHSSPSLRDQLTIWPVLTSENINTVANIKLRSRCRYTGLSDAAFLSRFFPPRFLFTSSRPEATFFEPNLTRYRPNNQGIRPFSSVVTILVLGRARLGDCVFEITYSGLNSQCRASFDCLQQLLYGRPARRHTSSTPTIQVRRSMQDIFTLFPYKEASLPHTRFKYLSQVN